jgi:hypothetical protein
MVTAPSGLLVGITPAHLYSSLLGFGVFLSSLKAYGICAKRFGLVGPRTYSDGIAEIHWQKKTGPRYRAAAIAARASGHGTPPPQKSNTGTLRISRTLGDGAANPAIP